MRKSIVVPSLIGAWAVAAAAALAVPTAPPPDRPPAGPPPAWIAAGSGEQWLAFSSYCWTPPAPSDPPAACATFVPPDMRDDVPTVTLRRKEVVRFHFDFVPTAVNLVVGKRSYDLPARASSAWRVRGKSGVALLSVEAPDGSASYVARFKIKKPVQRAAVRASLGSRR